ncbi:PEP-CTERM sorting domain-containing protein [Salinisphaera sp. SPP-AMP-43]|uniref:Npun_F0296 family exosortase-dependent surface protein n=1 Tax=Salinisphaera sp. SPP-AMP-43 TaxID=3121288 RepID=UPI003C6E2D2E
MITLGPTIRTAIAAVFALGISASAAATTITLDYTTDADGVATSAVEGVTTVDFNQGCGYASCSGVYPLVTHAPSAASLAGRTNNTQYLNQSAGTAIFSLGTTANYFGLLWDSIDYFNTISFVDDGRQIARYTGNTLVQAVQADGGNLAMGDSAYINFFDLPEFDTVRITDNISNFESDNHAYGMVDTSEVPEPTSVALFGLGLLLLITGLMRRRAHR